MTKARIFSGLAAISLAFGMTACGGGAPEAPAQVAPEAPAGIAVTDGRFNLPAVAGNPGVVYFTIANSGEDQATIRSVDMIGAGSAKLHETSEWNGQMDMQELFTVPVMAGETVSFESGGKHVMVYDVDPSLAAGGETEVTLTFAGGDKISFPVKILAAGDDGTMDHSGHEGM